MKKLHSRVKRRLGLTRSKCHSFKFGGRKRRQKTFKTEAAANAWAKANSMKEGSYSLQSAKKGLKFMIVKL
jgi:hypothetical protein